MKKLHNSAGRAAVTLPPREYAEGAPVTFTPQREAPVCNAIQPNAPQGYRWLHTQPNPRTGT